MKRSSIVTAAMATMALTWAFAASAGAETVPTYPLNGLPQQTFHTVQTPTGPLEVPDLLHFKVKMPDGEIAEVFISPCVRASAEQRAAYTPAERAASESWCMQAPKKAAKKKRGKGKKAHTATTKSPSRG
jgi:hypothetical protein